MNYSIRARGRNGCWILTEIAGKEAKRIVAEMVAGFRRKSLKKKILEEMGKRIPTEIAGKEAKRIPAKNACILD